MYVIIEAYDDNTAIVFNTRDCSRENLSEKQLINLSKIEDVLGLSVGTRSINYIHSYSFMAFEDEGNANSYFKENDISYSKKEYDSGYFWYFKRTNIVRHVDYYVVTYKGEEITYVGDKIKYTPYIQSAKVYDKREANKVAALMTRQSKTGTEWKALRVVR